MLPAPTSPSVRLVKPWPMKFARSFQRPLCTSSCFLNSRPASAKTMVSVATATGRRTAIGVFVTTMPLGRRGGEIDGIDSRRRCGRSP